MLKLEYYRKKKGLTQRELAKLIGLSQPCISQYENGIVNPNLDHVIKIAKVLNVSLDELIN